MGVGCTRVAKDSVEAHHVPPSAAQRPSRGGGAASSRAEERSPLNKDSPRQSEASEELPPFFQEVLGELERHRQQLGGLKNFQGKPRLEHKVTKKELTDCHSDYEYIYLTVLGLGRLHMHNEEIIRKNNGQVFNKNPGVQMLERVSGLTMHAEREGSTNLLRTAPASLIEAFQLSKSDRGGALKFFKTAFDRTGDPCLEGRMGRMMEYIELRQRSADPAACNAPPWEDVTVRSLPEGAPPQEVVGEHLRVFMAECTWRWAKLRGMSYDAAKEARQLKEHQEDFAGLFNAGAFEVAMLARGVASDACPRQWESSTKSGQWMAYEPDVSLKIDKAHAQKLPEISLRLGPKAWLYVIDFTKMVQRNPKTGQERPLRYVEASEGASHTRGGVLSREALAAAIHYFVDLETLPPAAGGSPSSTHVPATEAGGCSPVTDGTPFSAGSHTPTPAVAWDSERPPPEEPAAGGEGRGAAA